MESSQNQSEVIQKVFEQGVVALIQAVHLQWSVFQKQDVILSLVVRRDGSSFILSGERLLQSEQDAHIKNALATRSDGEHRPRYVG